MHDDEKSCDKKLAFETKKQAITAKTVASFQHNPTKLKVYKCRLCNLWHLASKW